MHGFITDDHAAFGQQLLDLTEAHTEAMMEPDGVGDDFRWDRCLLYRLVLQELMPLFRHKIPIVSKPVVKLTVSREPRAPVYHWFTEGFGTADLQEAKALLEQLT